MEQDFSITHDAYSTMLLRWLMALDFWRGGLCVLRPDHPIYEPSFVSMTDNSPSVGTIDPDAARRPSLFEWSTGDPWCSYIWKHGSESLREFTERCARAFHWPVFSPLINDVASGLLRTPPTRTATSEIWKDFWGDIDGAGMTIDAFIKHSVDVGFVFGRAHGLVDKPAGSGANSRADERILGDRPYCQILTPLDIINWSLTPRGNFRWVDIREEVPDRRLPGEKQAKQKSQFRVWDSSTWELWVESGQGKNGSFVSDGPNLHPFGHVPISNLFFQRHAGRMDMQCESPFASAVDIDRHFLNELSEIWEIDRTQSFSILAIPTLEGAAGAPIPIGPARAFSYPAGAGSPSYPSPDAALPQNRWLRALSKAQNVRSAFGLGRGMAEQSKEQRSASAIVEEMRGQLSQMAEWAGAVQAYDNQIHLDATIAYGMAPKEAPRASYLRSFYRTAILLAATSINQLRATGVLGNKAAARMVIPVVKAYLADFGASAEDMDAAEADIMDTAEHPPALPVSQKLPPTPPLFELQQGGA